MISNKNNKVIRVAMILEAIGRPPEHLTEILKDLIKQMRDEKGVEVIEEKVHEPELIKEQKDFWTNFAEVEVEVEDILYLAMLMFKYMPAHVEVISPESITLANTGWNDLFNELIRRLHGYDEIAAVLHMEKRILEDKLRYILQKHPEIGEIKNKEALKENIKEEQETKKNSKVKANKK
jgi:hypothetical protein